MHIDRKTTDRLAVFSLPLEPRLRHTVLVVEHQSEIVELDASFHKRLVRPCLQHDIGFERQIHLDALHRLPSPLAAVTGRIETGVLGVTAVEHDLFQGRRLDHLHQVRMTVDKIATGNPKTQILEHSSSSEPKLVRPPLRTNSTPRSARRLVRHLNTGKRSEPGQRWIGLHLDRQHQIIASRMRVRSSRFDRHVALRRPTHHRDHQLVLPRPVRLLERQEPVSPAGDHGRIGHRQASDRNHQPDRHQHGTSQWLFLENVAHLQSATRLDDVASSLLEHRTAQLGQPRLTVFGHLDRRDQPIVQLREPPLQDQRQGTRPVTSSKPEHDPTHRDHRSTANHQHVENRPEPDGQLHSTDLKPGPVQTQADPEQHRQ